MTATRAWTGSTFERARPATGYAGPGLTIILAFLAAHVVLGLVASQVPAVATVQGGLTVVVGLGLAFTSSRIDRILAVAGYAAVSDVFWRMNGSRMPWEAGKYVALLVLAVAFVRFVKWPRRIGVPVAFFALLLPACALTIVALPSGEARSLIAANLAGPALLAVAVIVLRQVVADEVEVATLLWILLGPILAVCTISTRATAEAGSDAFGTESSFAAAGGFGPNQVSMLLGLGGLICVVWALQHVSLRTLLVQVAVGGWCIAQAALTFSRGGLYGAAAGVAAIVVVAVATSGMRSRVAMGLAVGVVVALVAFPYLNSFTDGSLEQRFADTSTTNRADIATADLELFERSPLFGVGVGVAKYERGSTANGFETQTKAHTEYTRMLGEHGLLGLVSVGLLLVMVVQAVRWSTSRWNRIYAAAFAVWSLVSMSHSATSIAAIGFVFGLAQLRSKPGTDLASRPG